MSEPNAAQRQVLRLYMEIVEARAAQGKSPYAKTRELADLGFYVSEDGTLEAFDD